MSVFQSSEYLIATLFTWGQGSTRYQKYTSAGVDGRSDAMVGTDDLSLAVWIFHMFVYGFGVYTVFLEVECKHPLT